MAKLNINVLLQNTANVTVANIQDLNDYIKSAIPSAKLTWCPDNNFVFPGNKNAENILVNGYLKNGDDFAMGDGFPAVNFPNIVDYRAQVDEFWNTGFARYGKTPKVATSWHYTAEQLQYLEGKGVEIVTGTVWSQTNVDRFQGEGSRLFPYYPSKTNSFVPAKTESDKINIVSMNSLTADPLGCRVLTGDSRWTLHPADPNPNSSAVQKYIFDEYSKNDFPMCVYIEVDWLYGNTNLLTRFKEFIDYIKTKEVEILTMSEFNTYFRRLYKNNNFEKGLIFEGSGITYGNSQSNSNKIQYWYENQSGVVCLEKDKNSGILSIEACITFLKNIGEVRGYFVFEGHFYKDYSYRVGKSYKFDQHQKYSFKVNQNLINKAKKFFYIG